VPTGNQQSGDRVNTFALLTTVIKLPVGNGLVRISAGMVGILLNSCSTTLPVC